MINPKRVQRIKNVIYVFILLLFLIPAILFLVLSVKMLRIMPELDRIIAENSATYLQAEGQYQPQQAPSELGDVSPTETIPLPVPQGTSRVDQAPLSETSRPESSAAQAANIDTSRGDPDSAALPSGEGSRSEQQPGEESQPLLYGDIQSPNTGLPK